ncbi:MAG TPA: TonB-dependent receptor [Terriglobia bacterium]|nr:TonB-dependent receptor [Terriglobia bacterium]
MRLRTLICLPVLLTVISVWSPRTLRADVTGAILGTVTDPSGAAVPGATVKLVNADTGLARTTTSGTQGAYEFLEVPVGQNYRVEVEAKGFEKAAQAGIVLRVNQRFRADFQLVVGSTTQSIEITAHPVQVETTSTQLGDVIDDKKMTGLPLNGRSYIDLLGLQAGVVPITSDASTQDRPVSGTLSAGNVSVNGQRETANQFLVNGGDVQEGRNNGAAIDPTLDSIEEFRLLTNSFDAEYGRFSGAIVNVITKSGTNAFHGNAYEFLRNDKLDSRNFFDPTLGAFKRNQFGGTFGGPILKDRLFFFGDYQGTRERRGLSTGIIPVPSASERTGDFSDVDTTGFSPFSGSVRGDNAPGDFAQTLTSRLGYPVVAGEPYWVEGCNAAADALSQMCVFPNQTIPQAAWSPAATGTLQFVPTATGVLAGQPYFSSASSIQKTRDDKFGIRVDLNTQRTGNWSFYYNFDDSNVYLPFPAEVGNGSNVPGFSSITPSRAQQANLNNTHTFGPTAVNELRLNYTRAATNLGEPAGGLGKISSFGFVEGGLGIIPANPAIEGVPQVFLNQLGITFGTPSLTTGQYNNTYQVADNFSKVIGNHTVKFGGEYRYFQINERNSASVNASFSFNGGETANDFADYLIGAPDQASQLSRQFLDSRTKYYGLYAQDTFKIKPNLTLNYGLRWEASTPFYDTQGKIQGFVPGEQSQVYPNSPEGWVFPGDPGIPKTIGPTRWDNFAPRLGIAYSPGFTDGVLGKIFGGPGKTSIRAASGIYYTAIEDLTLFYEVGDAPFGQLYTSPTLVYFEEPYKDRLRNQDPGQRFPYSLPAPSDINFSIFQPITYSPGFKTDNVLPYAEHFNFTIERQIGSSMILSAGYIGTEGHHLVAQYDFNPAKPATCLQILDLYTAAGQASAGCGPYGEDTIYNISGQTFNGTRPYSVTSGRYLSQGLLDFGGYNTYTATIANSSYNALQVSLEKRVGAFTFLGAYTYSKSLDNSSGYADDPTNPYDLRISKALSSFDLTHNFVMSYSYNLPLQRLSSASSGAVHKLLTGWDVTGITRFTTGLPILVSENDDFSLCGCSGVDRPNYDGSPIQVSDPRSSPNNQYFSTTPFSFQQLGIAGNANRRFFHGPGLNNFDFALHKFTPITERMNLEFRAEFFNIFNHAQFTNPSGDITSSTFGQVTNARDPRIGQVALKLNF